MPPMTEAAYYILLALLKPGHGYGMMQRIRELSGGRLEMGPGTLYGVLSRMTREGLITFTGEEGRRKNYAITPAGRAALLAEYRRLKNLVRDGALLEALEPSHQFYFWQAPNGGGFRCRWAEGELVDVEKLV